MNSGMYTLKLSGQFKKSYKRCLKRGLDMALFQEVVDLLVKGLTLPAKYRNHSLTGNYQGWMECHIQPDWLFIRKYEEGELVLCLLSMGSHADLFGKNRK